MRGSNFLVQVSGADLFIGFGGVVDRPEVAAGADWYVRDLHTLVSSLKQHKVRSSWRVRHVSAHDWNHFYHQFDHSGEKALISCPEVVGCDTWACGRHSNACADSIYVFKTAG